MTPEMIRQLPAGRALVIRGGYVTRHRPAAHVLERPALPQGPARRAVIARLTPAAEDARLRMAVVAGRIPRASS